MIIARQLSGVLGTSSIQLSRVAGAAEMSHGKGQREFMRSL
jgi:hypothetical protein